MVPGVINAFAGVLGAFSIGYFTLPIFYIDMTPMRNLAPEVVASVTWMALLFHICVLVGLEIARSRISTIRPFTLPMIDGLLSRNWWPSTIVAASVYFVYITTIQLTSYSSDDFNSFFEEQTPFAGAVGFLGRFALGMIAVNLAAAVYAKRPARVATGLVILALIELILIGKGQRFVFIAPLFTVFAAMMARRQYRAAAIGILVGVGALVLVSPFAVMLREARTTDRTLTASNVSYDLGESPGQALLQSMLDRADGLEVATVLRDHFDRRGSGIGPRYYFSVLMVPIPRVLLGQKPTALSTTGTADGEISVLAWQLQKGNSLGSLTAFGFIVPYREGGWPMVIINGMATGLLFGFLLRTFARGGPVGQVLFTISFVNWCVARVPPSFWEAMVDVMTYLPIVLTLVLLNFFLSRRASGALPTKPPTIVA